MNLKFLLSYCTTMNPFLSISILCTSASFCAYETLSSATTISLSDEMSSQQHLFLNATNCTATNVAPTLTLSHYYSSFDYPSFVFSFDKWTPESPNSIVLEIRAHAPLGTKTLSQCASCYPSQPSTWMWISWTNETEISLGLGTQIGTDQLLAANYSSVYGTTSIEYISVWEQIGDCSFAFYSECEATEIPSAAPSQAPFETESVEEQEQEQSSSYDLTFVMVVCAVIVVLFVLCAITFIAIRWRKQRATKSDQANLAKSVGDKSVEEGKEGEGDEPALVNQVTLDGHCKDVQTQYIR